MIISLGEALVDVVNGEAVPGGGPMNVAVAAARLGVPAAFAARISTDAHGQEIREHLEASGVDLTVTQFGDEPTARAVVTFAPGPVFDFEGHGTADASMTELDLSPLGPGPHVLHGGTLGIFRGTTAAVYADVVGRHDGVVSFDPNVRPQIIDDRDEWWTWADRWIDAAHVIKGSDEDFDWMHPGQSVEEIASSYFERGVLVLLETRGGEGAIAHLADGSSVAVPGVLTEVVDTVGAGDTFCAGVLVGLHERDLRTPDALAALDGDGWAEVLGFAVRAAAVTCSRIGADPPWRSELD